MFKTSHYLKKISALLGAGCLILSTTANSAADQVGAVIFTIGDVRAIGENKASRTLTRLSPIYEHDVISTGANGSCQLRFVDDTYVSLKASGNLDISSYHFAGKKVTEVNKANSNCTVKLQKGTMGIVTGLIAKETPENYKVTTPMATISVRGTHLLMQTGEKKCGKEKEHVSANKCKCQCGHEHKLEKKTEGKCGKTFTLVVLAGKVNVSTPWGSHDYSAGQAINVIQGEAPKTIPLGSAFQDMGVAAAIQEAHQPIPSPTPSPTPPAATPVGVYVALDNTSFTNNITSALQQTAPILSQTNVVKSQNQTQADSSTGASSGGGTSGGGGGGLQPLPPPPPPPGG